MVVMRDLEPANHGPAQHSCGSYRSWDVGAGAQRAVDLIWQSRITHEQPESHRLLPFTEPSVALVRRFDASGATQSLRIAITAPKPDGGHYEPQPGEEIFACRLVPQHVETVLGIRPNELIDHFVDLPKALRSDMQEAMELAERGDLAAARRSMQQILDARMDGIREGRIEYAASVLRQSSGRLGPKDIADAADLSPRHMRRAFNERFGLSPRGWSRRLRLTEALIEADRSMRPEWAEIAAGMGFADQSHLIRTSRAILGESPGEIHRFRRNLAVSFNS